MVGLEGNVRASISGGTICAVHAESKMAASSSIIDGVEFEVVQSEGGSK